MLLHVQTVTNAKPMLADRFAAFEFSPDEDAQREFP